MRFFTAMSTKYCSRPPVCLIPVFFLAMLSLATASAGLGELRHASTREFDWDQGDSEK